MMKIATREGFPLRQGAGTGLDWFSVATEAFGGGGRSTLVDLRAVHEAGGVPRGWARPPHSMAARDSPGPTPILHGLLLVQK